MKHTKRGKVRAKSPEKELLASLGLMGYGLQDVEIPANAEAIGYDTVVENDGVGNYTEVQVVYFTNKEHTEEMGDLEYFDEHEDAVEYGQKVAQAFGLPFIGRYDNEDWIEPDQGADRIIINDTFEGGFTVYFGSESGDELNTIYTGDSREDASFYARNYSAQYQFPIYELA